MKKYIVLFSALFAQLHCMNHQTAQLQELGEQLKQAAYKGDETLVNQLLRGGADKDYSDEYGRTALWLACTHTRLKVALALLNAGANPNKINNVNRGPLCMTCIADSTERAQIARALLAAGANVHQPEGKGLTPLHEACRSGAKEQVKILLYEGGANPFIKDYLGKTAVQLAEDTSVHNSPEDIANKRIIVDLLNNYSPFFMQAHLCPTEKLLTTVIENGYFYLTKQILKTMSQTAQQINEYGQLAYTGYKKDLEIRYKLIGRLLKNYAQALRVLPKLSPKEKDAMLPQDLVPLIIKYTL
ncbi:ankyrin repeat domain-containing protein [Candidatus Dependentiae bacterium]|nr:ankyrin repeat domain-containing protein [Candidatus Dependentiae bacterium]